MAIKYDIYSSPAPSGSDRDPHYHARVVGSDTVDMEELIHRIHRRCTLTKGDLQAAFVELSDEIVNCLCAGDTIHIDEFVSEEQPPSRHWHQDGKFPSGHALEKETRRKGGICSSYA